jgi:hypothetical protein
MEWKDAKLFVGGWIVIKLFDATSHDCKEKRRGEKLKSFKLSFLLVVVVWLAELITEREQSREPRKDKSQSFITNILFAFPLSFPI